jgi:ribonuclease P protein component
VSASLLHLQHPRVGFVVPRHGRSAVDRNRLKRRLRELTRTTILPTLPVLDMVVHARPSAYKLSFDELSSVMSVVGGEASRIAARLVAVD